MKINLDELKEKLQGLSGEDFLNVHKQFRTINPEFVPAVQFEPLYQTMLAAHALGKNYHELQALPLPQFLKIISATSNFLFTTSDETEIEIASAK